ncbi:MAG: CHAP domain-containing protein [Myxococcales bacterium]
MTALRFAVLVAVLAALVGLGMVLRPDAEPAVLLADAGLPKVGAVLDRYRGIEVHENGPEIETSHGKSYGPGGFYYGKKWQCVEYVKRFYREALKHEMPDGWGHAKSFFDESVADGDCNKARGLVQYINGSSSAPHPDDLMVFDGSFGHVAIVTDVSEDSVEVIQQNVPGETRQKLDLERADGRFTITGPWRPAGWLRKQDAGCVP